MAGTATAILLALAVLLRGTADGASFNVSASEWITVNSAECPCIFSFEARAPGVRLRGVAVGVQRLSWRGDGLLAARADVETGGELTIAFAADAPEAAVALSVRITGREAPLREVEAAHSLASAGAWLGPHAEVRRSAPFPEPAATPAAARSLTQRLFGGAPAEAEKAPPQGAREAYEAAERAAGEGRLAEAAALYIAAARRAEGDPRALPGGAAEAFYSAALCSRMAPGGLAAAAVLLRRALLAGAAHDGAAKALGELAAELEGGGAESLELFGRAAAWAAGGGLEPRADHFLDLCRAAERARRWRAVEAACAAASELEPGLEAPARWFRAGAAISLSDLEAASAHIAGLRRATSDPTTLAVAASGRLLGVMGRMAWAEWDEAAAEVREAAEWTVAQPEGGVAAGAVTPWWAMSLPLPPDTKRAVLRRAARALEREAAAARRSAAPFAYPLRPHAGRLRVAFYGTGLGESPSGLSWRRVLAALDRRRVELLVYNGWQGFEAGRGPDAVARDIAAAAERHYVVRGWSARRIAEQVNADGAHVLVHCDFWTHDDLPQVSALRPAPVQLQVNIGTSGAPFFDYVLADPVAVAPEHALAELSERAISLPAPFSVAMNSHRGAFGDPGRASRAEHGLPPGRRVLAAFHRPLKLYPELIDLWANALRRSPSSILWTLSHAPPAPDTGPALRRELAARGLDPADRLVAAGYTSFEGQLRRAGLADAYLDAPLYNGVTTALDFLFAGVPGVTTLLDTISSRVGAGIVHAAAGGASCALHGSGGGECAAPVAASLKGYEELALRALRRGAGPASPLFDERAWAAAFEAALGMAAELAMAGEPPAHLVAARPPV